MPSIAVTPTSRAPRPTAKQAHATPEPASRFRGTHEAPPALAGKTAQSIYDYAANELRVWDFIADQAGVVTIATSPGFILQTAALGLLHEIFPEAVGAAK